MNPPSIRPDAKYTPVEHLNDLLLSPDIDIPARPRWQRYFEPVAPLSEGLPAPILGVMLLIWQLRDQDLQQRYSLRTRKSRRGFLSWCILHGRKEYRALAQAHGFWETLDQAAALWGAGLPADDPAHAISWLMVLIAEARSDLDMDLTSQAGRQQLLAWYLLYGRTEAGYADRPLADWQIDYLFSPSSLPGLNRLQALIYAARPDVRKAFPLASATPAYVDWFRRFITQETGLIDALRRAPPHPPSCAPDHAPPDRPFGVNVIGYAYGQSGIGEDARMAARALLTTPTPTVMIDFPPGSQTMQNDLSMVQHVTSNPVYSVNLFCLTALEQGRCFAERGSDLQQQRYNIGYWPWELANWPQEWRHLLALVDEVWVSSRHTFDAVQPVSPVPVRLMPMAVAAEPPAALTRADFDLPQQARLFLFAFDLNSSVARKNPAACIAAFLRAFPDPHNPATGVQQVGLVIKVHAPAQPNRDWEQLKRLQRRDPRIHLIEKTLDKPGLLALYQCCDCFVSLHRAEGFGRCIAEAMLLGKPVITTGYSGNLDFTNDANALLVRHDLVPLAPGDYPYGAGLAWAEPDIAHAARHMRKIVEDAGTVSALAASGQACIRRRHAPEVVGRTYADALQALDARPA